MKGSSSGFGDLKKLHQAATRAREQARREERAAMQKKQTAQASPEDAQLFRRAMQAVTPIHPGPVAKTRPATAIPAAPSPEQLAKRQSALGQPASPASPPVSDLFAPSLQGDTGVSWFAPDMAADTPRRLKRGQWPIQARIDLHGLRMDAAREALLAFLADCLAHRVRCIRVIHGKGYGSGAEPVLREKTPAWLMQHAGVCAFVQAPPEEGGEGALIALLRPANTQNH